MKISASIYSNPAIPLPDLVRELEDCGVDLFHMDSKDNLAVFEDIETIRSISKLPIDLHVISSNPSRFFNPIKETGVEFATFQFEDLDAPLNWPGMPACRLGISISANTPVSVFEKFRNEADFILMMTTTPGESGGQFNRNTFQKIHAFQRDFPGKKVHVDGGVNDEVSFILRNMGIRAVVSGSYLVAAESIPKAMLNMKIAEVDSHFQVRDFMLPQDELPVLLESELTFEKIINAIEDYKLGFCLVVDATGKLKGLVTNADIRRGIIRNMHQLESIPTNDLINPQPRFVHEDRTVGELLKLVRNIPFPVLFLPVVNQNHQLSGAISFNNLIKGES